MEEETEKETEMAEEINTSAHGPEFNRVVVWYLIWTWSLEIQIGLGRFG